MIKPEGVPGEDLPADLSLRVFESFTVGVKLFGRKSCQVSKRDKRWATAVLIDVPRDALEQEANCPQIHRIGLRDVGNLTAGIRNCETRLDHRDSHDRLDG